MSVTRRPSPTCPICGLTDADGPCQHGPRTTMMNLAMARKLSTGEVLDVRVNGHPLTEPDANGAPAVFVLDRYTDGVDYCDAQEEAWIWSIGRYRHEGPAGPQDPNPLIYAATDARFAAHPEYETLWVR